jgi:hypothetical protein
LQENHLDMVCTKLQPLRDLFPPPSAETDTPGGGSHVAHHSQCPMKQYNQQQLQQYGVHQGQAGSIDMDSSSMQGSSILGSSSICTDFDNKDQHSHSSKAVHPKVKAWAKRMLRSLRGKHAE